MPSENEKPIELPSSTRAATQRPLPSMGPAFLQTPAIALSILFATWAICRILFFEGLWGYDDLSHAFYAAHYGTPRDVFEARLLLNYLLIIVRMIFGHGEWQLAVPSLLGSATFVLATYYASRRILGKGYDFLAALLASLLALDVSMSTVAMAHPIGNAFTTIGAVLLLVAARKSRPSSNDAPIHNETTFGLVATSGAFVGLALTTHLAFAFFTSACFLLAMSMARGRQRIFISCTFAAAALGTFLVVDGLLFYVAAGEPLRFEVIQATHLKEPPYSKVFRNELGEIELEWFLWPLKQLVLSKHFGLVLSLPLVCGLLVWRRLDQGGRTALVLLVLGWLCTNFLSQSLSHYYPLDRQLRYWYPIAFPACFLAAAVARALGRSSLRRVYLVGLLAPLPLLLGAAGPWGQNVELSRELLDHSKAHPELQFATDVYSYEEMLVLDDDLPPENVVVFGETEALLSHGHVRLNKATTGERGAAPGDTLYLLINELNLARPGAEGLERAALSLERTVIAPAEPRPLARLVGLDLIERLAPERLSFWTRKPAATVSRMPVDGLEIVTTWATTARPALASARARTKEGKGVSGAADTTNSSVDIKN